MARAPRATNQIKTHAGMLSPKKVQFTTAHSPELVKIIAMPSDQPNASTR